MKLSWKEYLGHAVGGIGHNLIYALFSGFLLIFYTDVFGLSPAFTGTLFLVARFWDAINDPMFGALADRTKSKWGRYRVWLFFAGPVIGAALILCFYVPNFSTMLRYVYCYVTYILLGMAFTCADVPYWTLPSVMTANPSERNKVFSISTIATCLASGVGAIVVPLIVEGAGSAANGYLLSAIIFAAIGIVCYDVTAFSVRERIAPKKEHYSLKKSLKCVFSNKPLLIVMAASLCGNFAFQMKIAITTYYGTYALGNYLTVTYLSAMLLVGMLIGAGLAPFLIKRIGAKTSLIATLAFGVVTSLGYYFSGYSSLAVVLVWNALSSIVLGAFTVIVNSMTADTMDYAELKEGERSEGIITSTRTFITKLATAIAGALVGYILEIINYVPNVAQTVAVNDTFQAIMSLYPAILYAVALIILIFYPLGKKQFGTMEKELDDKRKKALL